jgi:cobaltochelatase CobN
LSKDGVFIQSKDWQGESRTLRVVEGHLFVCQGCCCGNVNEGRPAVPLERFKSEWKARGIRSRIHLTVSGCLGPCTVPNVVLFSYKGSTIWFKSINDDSDVVAIYDYLGRILDKSEFLLPTGMLAKKVFQRYAGDAICATTR